MLNKYLFLVFFLLIEMNAKSQILQRFEPQKDQTILELFNKKYNSTKKKKKFFTKLFAEISNDKYGEFDDSDPYERKFAYFFIELNYLGINDVNRKDKYSSESIQQVLLLANIQDTNVIKQFYQENKDFFIKLIPKADFGRVIADLLKCYERLSLLNNDEISKYEGSYLLHWGYESHKALKNKQLKFYKPSFYIDWLYNFWINARQKNIAFFLYKIIFDISKNIDITKEDKFVWKWDKDTWENNIKITNEK